MTPTAAEALVLFYLNVAKSRGRKGVSQKTLAQMLRKHPDRPEPQSLHGVLQRLRSKGRVRRAWQRSKNWQQAKGRYIYFLTDSAPTA